MEGLFLGGSLLAAFVAGSVALFAPCCIVVMFPAFLAASVRNNRWRLVPLTFIFTAGLATVLLPITLGLSMLTESLLRFHTAVYAAGGVLLIVLAVISLTGANWSLPFLRGAPDVSRTDSAGVFALGVFSGAASACCAPVLAGALMLSALNPSLIGSAGVGMAYIFGMVFPLLLMTLAWDRLRPEHRAFGSRRVAFRIAGVRISSTRSGIAASIMFILMAAVLLVVAFTGASLTNSATAGMSRQIEDFLAPVLAQLAFIPDFVAGMVLVAIAAGAIWLSARRPRSAPERTDVDSDTSSNDEHGNCHTAPEDDHAHAHSTIEGN
ncbi:MAG: cytochrome c biogenesis protein CcdA [Actinobacteria bacterium HGW-Actinobacteria-4]|nr:MAG: cytochrome c biogenesis protein CcdA [Actinobacteria bacterium HGW-Actinobacteria-4]